MARLAKRSDTDKVGYGLKVLQVQHLSWTGISIRCSRSLLKELRATGRLTVKIELRTIIVQGSPSSVLSLSVVNTNSFIQFSSPPLPLLVLLFSLIG